MLKVEIIECKKNIKLPTLIKEAWEIKSFGKTNTIL